MIAFLDSARQIYSKDKNALAEFILRFKKACEDKPFILDLFSRAELD